MGPWISRGVAYHANDSSPIHSTVRQQKSMQTIFQYFKIYVEGVLLKTSTGISKNVWERNGGLG